MTIAIGSFLPFRWPWQTVPEPPPPDDFAGKLIILASEGRPIPQVATKFAGRMAEKAGAEVHVLSIARIWGTSFGLPNPGLLPNKREMRERHESVAGAITLLKRRNIAASGQVTGTRNAAKRIVAEARHRGDLRDTDAPVFIANRGRRRATQLIRRQRGHRGGERR